MRVWKDLGAMTAAYMGVVRVNVCAGMRRLVSQALTRPSKDEVTNRSWSGG